MPRLLSPPCSGPGCCSCAGASGASRASHSCAQVRPPRPPPPGASVFGPLGLSGRAACLSTCPGLMRYAEEGCIRRSGARTPEQSLPTCPLGLWGPRKQLQDLGVQQGPQGLGARRGHRETQPHRGTQVRTVLGTGSGQKMGPRRIQDREHPRQGTDLGERQGTSQGQAQGRPENELLGQTRD